MVRNKWRVINSYLVNNFINQCTNFIGFGGSDVTQSRELTKEI
ncbi:MAG: hypothetical protein K0R00_4190 [Herbinix sp.]|jgi:hypothetical protein|nr:hypothetical protein [Herbinix sp.]